MGSDSDLPIMKDAARILNMFGVPHEVFFFINLQFSSGIHGVGFLSYSIYA